MNGQTILDTPANGAAKPTTASAVPAPVLPPPKRRRRPVVLAAGVVLVILGALGAYALAASANDRVAITAVASDVSWGEQITAADLVEVDITTGTGLAPIAWADRGSIIGERAAAELHAGGIVTNADIMTAQVPSDGRALVGVAVKPGQLPATTMRPGQRVRLVHTPTGLQPASGGDGPDGIEATVFAVSDTDATLARTVDVLVADSDAQIIATWSATGDIAIVVVAGQ